MLYNDTDNESQILCTMWLYQHKNIHVYVEVYLVMKTGKTLIEWMLKLACDTIEDHLIMV